MTECERIIKERILPEQYFNEETKCDFLVTKDRKKLFAVLLDILLKIDSVCKKHNIQYFIYGGTLMGAVRHKGIIPWDDDVDIAMTRENYNKLLAVSYEFDDPYLLQTPYTDKGFFWANATVRNKNTTAVTPYFAYQPMCHGAFVDIFVMDNIVDTQYGRDIWNRINRLTIDNSTYMRMSNPKLDDENRKRVEEYRSRVRDPYEVYEEIHKLAQTFDSQQTMYITTPTATFYGFEKKLHYKEDYSETVDLELEGYKFPAPAGWDRILKTTYHDYMQMPPMEQRGLHHNIQFNMDLPYTEYIDKYIK